MKVIFLKQYNPGGSRIFNKGDVFEFTDQTARFLQKLHVVKLEVEREEKRTYKRRDMKAER